MNARSHESGPRAFTFAYDGCAMSRPDSSAETKHQCRPDSRVGALRSYGRRKSHALSPRQDKLLAELMPRVALDMAVPASSAGDVAGQFSPMRPRAVWLEIGFGGGEHLAAQATEHPDVGIIGCEPFVNGVVKLLDRIERDELNNVRIFGDDARMVLDWLPASSIDRVFVLYPDPWPKKKHVKRRLLNAQTLAAIARVLKPGCPLLIATDIGDYIRTILLAMRHVTSLEWTARSASDWQTSPNGWPGTRYEDKALREGRRPHYLTFQKV